LWHRLLGQCGRHRPAEHLRSGNEKYGIYVGGQARPTLEGNTCRENKDCGIAYWDSAAGTARQNTCVGNEGFGIYVGGQARPTLEGNTCRENKYTGIAYWGSAAGTARQNTCVGNEGRRHLCGRAGPAHPGGQHLPGE
jgi:parallel beta-helix repeat protein